MTSLPGPSAAVVALTLAGLLSDRFLFAGFLPAKDKARRGVLADLAGVPATLVFYDNDRPVLATDPWLDGTCYFGSSGNGRPLTDAERGAVESAR